MFIRKGKTKLPALAGTSGWYFFCSWLSLKARGFNSYHTTTSALYLLLMFISNLFYPAELLPGWISWPAWLNPVTWQVDQIRYAPYGGVGSGHLVLEAVACILFVLFAFLAANKSLNPPIE